MFKHLPLIESYIGYLKQYYIVELTTLIKISDGYAAFFNTTISFSVCLHQSAILKTVYKNDLVKANKQVHFMNIMFDNNS